MTHATLTRLATLGLAGQVILLAAAWLLPLVSEYSLIGDTISELALGRYGLVMSAAIWLAGIGTIALKPFADGKQRGAGWFGGWFAPRTRLGVGVRNRMTRLMNHPAVARLVLAPALEDRLPLPQELPADELSLRGAGERWI